MEYLIQGGLIFAVLSFVYVTRKEMTDTMGELKSHCKDREHSTVRKEECHKAMDDMGDRFNDLKTHLDTRLDDIKDLIKQNGNH